MPDAVGYAIGKPLVTTNAGTTAGVSNTAAKLADRLYPPAFIKGPSGQLIPNTDFVTGTEAPGPQRRVDYQISDKAKYSDGKPVECTDFLLSVAAGRFPGVFDSNMPLTDQIESVDCEPNGKKFGVVFKPGFGSRWRELFGPGTVLPAHAITNKAGVGLEDMHAQLDQALASEDPSALEPVAKVWREGFNLSSFDPELQVSSGPYKIDHVTDGGKDRVDLVRNEAYGPEGAALDRIAVYPGQADEAAKGGKIQVADYVGRANVEWATPPNDVKQEPGNLVEALQLSTTGVFADKEQRQAFSKCVDRVAVAQASSKVAEQQLGPIATHLVTPKDPLAGQFEDIAKSHMTTDLGGAAPLGGTTVRIGYDGPDQRKAAMVESIRVSCSGPGVEVVDASGEGNNLGALREGKVDAYLWAADPAGEFGKVDAPRSNVEALRADEKTLWDQATSIPLAEQPRTFVISPAVKNVVVNTGESGIGWNMNRWQETNEQ